MALDMRMALLRAFSFVGDPEISSNKDVGDEGQNIPDAQGTGTPRRFNWKEAVADASIIAGLNFFSTLSAIGATQITSNPWEAVLAALIAAGFGFFSTLAIKRGLKTT